MAKTLSFQDTRPMHMQTERSPSPHGQWRPWRRWFGKDHGSLPPAARTQFEDPKDDLGKKRSKKAIPGLPRPGTFRRQQSELRENLEPVKIQERRALSVDPRQGDSFRESSRTSVPSLPRTSAPGLLGTTDSTTVAQQEPETIAEAAEPEPVVEDIAEPPPLYNDVFDDDLEDELEKRWILNLSMHFRDRSNREKFFVTFAETPTHWRRVTVSVDYRDAPPNSLELELQHTQYQRDKSAKIYEAIRDSLLDIQFYETVTNLKLATESERLHVHVTEDINEVIHFPPAHAIGHLQNCMKVKEKDVEFDSHLSGFVYKVNVNGHVFIKKEIPGPDTVEEFLYEVNALHRLSGSDSVIHFGGVITDNEGRHLKGLLISYAEKGALIDVLYDGRGELPWSQRERWAKQIVQGLSEIHEAGFVQGDFTLSNIVIDGDDKAKIIDINRRGCPVGWEPPEVAALIESKQRIAMYIGVKSDIFQLGMVLWAIGMQQDEPDIQPRPLTLHSAPDEIPSYYRKLVHTCLSDDPEDRRNTSYLLNMFPELEDAPRTVPEDRDLDGGEQQYIDPATAVNREDIERFRRLASPATEHANMDIISTGSHTYVNPPTDISGEAYFFPTRGRSPTRLPVEEAEHRHSSHVSPLDMGRGADAEDLASPEGEPIVVDVSPERHYLSREEPSTIDVAYAEPETPSARDTKMEDDDVSIDLNDAARASLEEYWRCHEELVEDPQPVELLTSQVYQPSIEHISHSGSHAGDCAYATPPRSDAGDVLNPHDSYADMGETTYFDPVVATDDRQGSVGPGLLTPAPWEEQKFITPQIDTAEHAPILEDNSRIEYQYEDNALRFANASNKEHDTPQPVIVPAVDEVETRSSPRHSMFEADQPSAAGEEGPIHSSLERTLRENHGGTLSSGWIDGPTPDLVNMNLEGSRTEEVVPSTPNNLVADTVAEPTKPCTKAAVDSPVDLVVDQLQTFSARSSLDKTAPETTIMAVETDDGSFKHVENRADSGFASHYDPNSPTSRRTYGLDSPLETSEKC